MEGGDIILSLITLLFFVLLFINPYMKRINGKGKKTVTPEEVMEEEIEGGRASSSYRIGVCERDESPVPGAKKHPEGVIESRPPRNPANKEEISPLERIEKLPALKRALVWSEILPRPPY